MKPMIAIVGRPNVGKSTLFNRLLGRRAAIVDDMPGVTRDRLIADAQIGGRQVLLVDTGGFEPNTKDELVRGAVQQAQLAMEEADLVLFVCDARDGLHPMDRAVSTLLRKSHKPTLCVANKADPGAAGRNEWEFDKMGLDLIQVSALHGTGFDELVQTIERMLPAAQEQEPAIATKVQFRLCLLGRPNVGKSSLANRLLGSDRQMVSPIPGTTRDAVDIELTSGEFHCVLVDTPGVRRKARIAEKLEHFSVLAALRSVERADVAVLVLDGHEVVSDQDAKLIRLVQERGRGLVIAVNKTDLWNNEERTRFRKDLVHAVRFASYAPILEVSARTGAGISQILPEVGKVLKWMDLRIGTGDLNRFAEDAIERLEPPVIRGKRAKLYYITQVEVRPPTFVAWVNDPERISESYRRYLERRLRRRYSFVGTPLRWHFRQRQSDQKKKRRGKGGKKRR